MTHKANETFFDKKKEWSKKKDAILDYYLPPYLAKVAIIPKPIVLIDGFAGRGRYHDDEIGSPIYLCTHARQARGRGADVRVLCIEENQQLCEDLRRFLSEYDFAMVRQGRFEQYLADVLEYARSSTVFLFLDPYTVEGLNWEALDKIFAEVKASNSSIEILLNFNAASFVRRGKAALKLAPSAAEIADSDDFDSRPISSTTIDSLNQIAGGEWWKQCLFQNSEYAAQVHILADTFKNQLRTRFNEVCMVAVKEKQSIRFPKYYLIFASRHPDALILMNEAMGNAINEDLISMDLFASSQLPTLILESTDAPLRRTEIVARVVRRDFCRFREKEIVKAINALIREGSLISDTGVTRTNKDTVIRRAPSLFL